MDKRKAWRDQEEKLVQRWNAAVADYGAARSEVALAGGDAVSAELRQKVESTRAAMEALRKQIARLKAEFSTGKRY